jgi:4-hydroxy-tetrahydrodipicolinate reductase
MIKVTVSGAAGRMGKALIDCVQKHQDLELVGAVEHNSHPGLGKDCGTFADLAETGVLLSADLAEALQPADVLIDFALHEAAAEHAQVAARERRAVVLGTTGLDADETGEVQRAAEHVPIVWAPNMSLGVNLLFAMAKKAGAVLGSSYQVRIDETHHIHKKDAPSGTALRLGEKVAQGLDVDFDKVMLHDENGQMDAYPEGKLAIRSFREGEVVGDHTVQFANEVETIELTHHAWSRNALAMGALRAAEWVVTQRPGLYDMQNVNIVSSPVYDTEPVDVDPAYADLSFLNTIVTAEYDGDPRDLIRELHKIEADMGRVRGDDQNAPRPVDIDVISAGDQVIREETLNLPHPRWSERRFVVQPLADVEPDLKLPGETRTVREVLDSLPEKPTATLFKQAW